MSANLKNCQFGPPDRSARRALSGVGMGLVLLWLAASAAAQPAETPNGLLLVAKPGMLDPNFSETVVLVTQTPDFHTLGVILNRPTQMKLSEFFGDRMPPNSYTDAVYAGGPVLRSVLVAVLHSETPPAAAAFPVLKGVYLSMHPAVIEPLLESRGQRYRLYAGFSGWVPRQLESELARDAWYVLPAREELLFRRDTAGLWEELVDQATGRRAVLESATTAAVR